MTPLARYVRDNVERHLPVRYRPFVRVSYDEETDSIEVENYRYVNSLGGDGFVAVMTALRKRWPALKTGINPETIAVIRVAGEQFPARGVNSLADLALTPQYAILSVSRAEQELREADVAIAAQDCESAIERLIAAIELIAEAGSVLGWEKTDVRVVGTHLRMTQNQMRARDPAVYEIAEEAWRVGQMRRNEARDRAEAELRQHERAFVAAHKSKMDNQRHNAATAKRGGRAERLDAPGKVDVVDRVLARIDTVFARAIAKNIPGAEGAQAWLAGNRMRAAAKIARKLKLAEWSPSEAIWTSVYEDMSRDPGLHITHGALLADAGRQLQGFPEYFNGLSERARDILDGLAPRDTKPGPKAAPVKLPEHVDPNAVFYAATSGGKWDIVVTLGGVYEGKQGFDTRQHKNGRGVAYGGTSDLNELRRYIQELIAGAAQIDKINFIVKLDKLGLAKDSPPLPRVPAANVVPERQVPQRIVPARTAVYKPSRTAELPWAFVLDGIPRIVMLKGDPGTGITLRAGVTIDVDDLFPPVSQFDELCRKDYAQHVHPFIVVNAIRTQGVFPATTLYLPQNERQGSVVDKMAMAVEELFWMLWKRANPGAEVPDGTQNLEGFLGDQELGPVWQPLATMLHHAINREPPRTQAEFNPWLEQLNDQVRFAFRENVAAMAAAWAPAHEAFVCWSDEVFARGKDDSEARRLAAELPSPDALAKGFGLREPAPLFTAGAMTPAAEAPRRPIEITEAWTPAQRTKANIAAMELAATLSAAPTEEERRILMGYTGWGGLSIRGAEGKFPADFPRPDPSGLIHEFYTPAVVANEIARVVRPLLPNLPQSDAGGVQALEPSAGIGRMLNAFEGARLEWHAVEWSELSYRMLRALRPDVDLMHSSFETWVQERGRELQGHLGLIISNPPYGARGASITDDPDREYREKMAYHYFLRRALDLLAPNGLGVFLVPGGFLSGKTPVLARLREKVLKRHHLATAFRLPSVGSDGREAVFPGAMLVVDVLVFRARDGQLDAVDPGDTEIVEGRYFELFPKHVLGKEIGKDGGEDDQTAKPRWGYQIQGDFTRLPDIVERPICAECKVTPRAFTVVSGGAKTANKPMRTPVVYSATDAVDVNVDDLKEEIGAALLLGRRVERYLVDLTREPERAYMAHSELVEQLNTWVKVNGLPRTNVELVNLAKREIIGAQKFLDAFEANGKLIQGLRVAPVKTPVKWRGAAKDIVGQAAELYRRSGRLTMVELLSFHISLGGPVQQREATDLLRKAGWAWDGDNWDELVPPEIYYTGALWPKMDRAMAAVGKNLPFAQNQVDKLLDVIKPAMFEDLDAIQVRDGWIVLDLVAEWFNATQPNYYDPIRLERKDGLITFKDVKYENLDGSKAGRSTDYSPEALSLLGYLNHDKTLFKVSKGYGNDEDEKDLDKRRVAKANEWSASFMGWVSADGGRKVQLMHGYNRMMRGYVQPVTNADPLPIVRWSPTGLTPHAHQVIGARRVLENRRGMLAFDVGVGKTLTGLMVLARARQEGWAKRPVILVPNTIAWKWYRDIKKSLPDFNVGVIGSIKSVSHRGERLEREIGLVTAEWITAKKDTTTAKAMKEIRAEAKTRVIVSKTDTPAQRAAKWTKFQAGEYDCVIVTYSVFNRTRMSVGAVRKYAETTSAIQREIAIRKRNAGKKKKLSEREEAILREGTSAWVAEQMELPSGQSYDPGIVWDDLNVDLLIVDEAQNFKNLYLPEPREGGVPRFMGNAGDGSKRAWNLDFRAASVRQRTGGSGIVLLSATPAKNSPLEFYNVIQYIDPEAWHRIGIRDPEGFIDRFLKIEIQPVVTPKMEVEERGAVVGFVNLDVLRDVVFRYGDFKTAKDVGLVLPTPTIEQVWVDMDAIQDQKYDRYVREIEESLASTNPKDKMKILGLLARMAMVAIHADLDMGFEWKTADQVTDAHSPKFDAMAERILANRDCGHIVFCENVAAHRWIYTTLVDGGIKPERIAFLNAEAVPGAAERQQIAMEFNGNEEEELAPRFDIVICNSVAYEGIDLQTRTCAIHHIDLPWEPATLEQRNGRGVRQGNTRQTITINYYMARRSQDGLRFNLIDGKAGWMRQLITSMDKETNNPGAQAQMSPEDVLAMISRDPEKTRAALQAVQARREEEARVKIAGEASRLLKAVNARFRQAERTTLDETERTRLRVEAEQRLKAVERTDPKAWPFGRFCSIVKTQPIIVVDGGGPLWSGLKIGIPSQWNAAKVQYLEMGDVSLGGWVREAGEATWNQVTLGKDSPMVRLTETSYNATFPADEHAATVRAIQQVCSDRLRYSGDWLGLHWDTAPVGWVESYWPETSTFILEALAKVSYYNAQAQRLPLVGPAGLVVGQANVASTMGVEVIPPTEEGWRRFLELAPLSQTKFTPLSECARWWWNRSIPRNILVDKDENANAGFGAAEMVAKLERR